MLKQGMNYVCLMCAWRALFLPRSPEGVEVEQSAADIFEE